MDSSEVQEGCGCVLFTFSSSCFTSFFSPSSPLPTRRGNEIEREKERRTRSGRIKTKRRWSVGQLVSLSVGQLVGWSGSWKCTRRFFSAIAFLGVHFDASGIGKHTVERIKEISCGSKKYIFAIPMDRIYF